jgi:hypothetical protein
MMTRRERLGEKRMSRPLALGLGAAATYGLGFIFENVVASAQATTSRTLDSTPALLAPIAGWLLIALAIAALALPGSSSSSSVEWPGYSRGSTTRQSSADSCRTGSIG